MAARQTESLLAASTEPQNKPVKIEIIRWDESAIGYKINVVFTSGDGKRMLQNKRHFLPDVILPSSFTMFLMELSDDANNEYLMLIEYWLLERVGGRIPDLREPLANIENKYGVSFALMPMGGVTLWIIYQNWCRLNGIKP